MVLRTRVAAGTVLLLLAAMIPALPGLAREASASPAPPAPPGSSTVAGPADAARHRPPGVAPEQRDTVLGKGWRKSTDIAWTTSGDADGLHILAARAVDGYAWRPVTTLSEPGFETDTWIGNACVTGSGRRLAVAYAPRTFTNSGLLFARGAFTALVDLKTGAVTKLPFQASLAYYSPGCGTGDSVVFTQSADEDSTRTRLVRVDARTAKHSKPIDLTGQVTSAVPLPDGTVAAADQHRIVRIGTDGTRRMLAPTNAVPFKLVAGADGGLTYLDYVGGQGLVQHLTRSGRKPTTLARGDLAGIDLTRDAAGRPYATGAAKAEKGVQAGSVTVLALPKGSLVSTRGESVVTSTTWSGVTDPRQPVADPSVARPADIAMRVRATGRQLTSTTDVTSDQDRAGRGANPATAPTRQQGVAAAGSPTSAVEDERTCSVPRNDPRNQTMQPKPRQVEWAVDQAVRNVLTVQRPANWKNLGMPAYTPQGLFPALALYGGGYVPAQVLLGIAAQESNLWQANGRALPGVTGNPLIGNFYGRDIYDDNSANDWDIHWADADCGYGVMQLTDGMRLAGREGDAPAALPYQTQRAVALDFAANIAAGLQLLISKWNQTRTAGMYVNNGDPKYIENWFYAMWAYNSGFHPDKGDGSPWGVGWLNNPVNPHYPANRDAFLDKTMADAAHPQFWPYQEKVLGFAGHPIDLPEAPNVMVAAFRPAVWNGGAVQGPINRTNVKPPVDKFCDATNSCAPGGSYLPGAPDVVGEPAGPCYHKNPAGQYDLHCWYNRPAVWKTDCPATCGYELLRFDPGYAYQEDGTSYAPRCDLSGLPTTAMVVDDVPYATPSIRPNCSASFANTGTFSLNFASDSNGLYPSKIDFHQFGAGFNGHFYSGFTRGPNYLPDGFENKLSASGTWKLSAAQHQWMRIKVFVPDTGAWTRQARYDIDLGNGQRRFRVVNQAWQAHTWVDLGMFHVDGIPSVTLSTYTKDGVGSDTVVFDALAFIPSVAPSAQYVALGDSYSSGEGLSPFLRNSDYLRSDNGQTNACHRSVSGAYPTQVTLPGHTATIAQDAANGTASFAFLACSGAMTTNITMSAYNDPPEQSDLNGYTDWGPTDFGYPDSQYGELPQVDQGYLDQDTTMVTLTIGGNDARFAEVIRSCALALDSCYGDSHKLTRDSGVVDPEILRVYEKKLMREMLTRHLVAVYQAIHAHAPQAKILVLGYPQLFGDRQTKSNCVDISVNEMLFLNTLADLLNTTIAHAVDQVHETGTDIRFLNVTQRWRESHSNWACDDWTEPWVRGGVLTCTNGSGTETPCRSSYHPTLAGQRQLADLINIQLRGVSSTTTVQQRILAYVATRTPTPNPLDPNNAMRWVVSDAQATEVAQRCLNLTRIGGVVGDPCMTYPMLVVTTRDAGGAALNDADALSRLPWWVELNYTSDELKEQVLPRDWFTQRPYKPNPCDPNTKQTGDECDEYPFYSSELGGAFDPVDGYPSESSTRLRWVPSNQNRTEGIQLGAMYTACDVKSSLYGYDTSLMDLGDPYLTIPVVDGDPAAKPATFYVC